MNCIVTGGCGFIGSHLVERLLKDGHKVKVIDNLSTGRIENLQRLCTFKDLTVKECDITCIESIQSYFNNVDWVFHLAALADIVPSVERPSEYYRSNVTGTLNVLETLRKKSFEKFIYAASSSCYGIPDVYPTSETAAIKPQYPYALTKYLGEQLALHWCAVYKMPVVSLRFFNVYGPRSRTSGTYGAVFGVFLAQKLANKPFTIIGDGSQTRDFVFVTDAVNAIVKSAESEITGEVFNIGSGQTYSVNHLVELLGGSVVHIPKRPGEPDCTWTDITKAKKLLDWKPEVTFEEGVKIILENIDYWRNAPVWDPKSIEEATKTWFKYL